MYQLGDRGDALLLQLVLHEGPAIFNQIQVLTVARPVNDLEGLLLEKLLDALGGMAGHPFLEKVSGAEPLHPGQQMVFDDLLVAFSVHRRVFGRKKRSPRPAKP